MSDERQGSYSVEQEPIEHEATQDVPHGPPVGDLLRRISQLEGRVEELEVENHTLQFTEEQYKDEAHQAQMEKVEQKEKFDESQLQVGILMVQLENEKAKFGELSMKHLEMQAEFDVEIADKMRVEEALHESDELVGQLKIELQAVKVRVETLGLALDAAYEGQRRGARRVHSEIGESSRSVRRRVLQ